MKRKRWVMLVIIAVVGLITIVLYTQSKSSGSLVQQAGQPTQDMIKFQATREDIVNNIEIKGKSSYVKETWVYSPFASEVKTWNVHEGMQVRKGDVLFELSDNKLRDSIELMQANQRKQLLDQKLNQMKAKLEREKISDNASLSDSQGGSIIEAFDRYAKDEQQNVQDELDRIQHDITMKELADNQDKMAKAKYTAQESGIFLFQETKEPNRVTDEKPVGKIVDTSKIQLICTVGEFEVFQIKPGMEVSVRIDALKQTTIKGKVERISKFAKTGTDQVTGTAQFEVTISLEANSKLIAGLSLTGSIQTDRKSGATVVPTLAVLHEQDDYFVYVERNGSVEKQSIKLGLETPDKTEVLDGIKVGDTIVLQ
jgi:macrolide-specific efflux system membrane fusion protein